MSVQLPLKRKVRKQSLTQKIVSSTLCLLSLATPSVIFQRGDAYAEFLPTGPNVYQDTYRKEVRVISGTKEGGTGIFVLVGPAIDPQEFDLEKTPRDGTEHLFIRFDESSQPPSYSEVIINDRLYKISGNLTIKLGENSSHVTVGIDNTNPYLTVQTEEYPGDPKAAIIGFSGTQEVVRGGGGATTAVLAANQLDRQVAEVIKPYTVKNNSLLINGKGVTTPTVGIPIQRNSRCLKPDTIVLKTEQMSQLRGARNEEQKVKLLQQFIADNKKWSPLTGHLVLKADPSSVVLLSVTDKNVRVLSSVVDSPSKKNALCAIAELGGG